MSGVNQLQFYGYYVSVWTNAESFVFRDVTVKMDNYLRFYDDGEVITTSKSPLGDTELKDWITNKFSRWTEEDFEKNGKPPYYNVNSDPNHPYILANYTKKKKSGLKFTFKWSRDGKIIERRYEGTINKDTLEFTVRDNAGETHKEIFQFIPLGDISYTTRQESDLYQNFVLHHFTSHFGSKPQKLDIDLGVDKKNSPIELFHIRPSESHPYYIVFTCGMGKRAMITQYKENKYAELCFLLPPNWNIYGLSHGNPIATYPFKSLLLLANYPFENRTYLTKEHVVTGSDYKSVENLRGINFIGGLFCHFSSAFGYKNYSINSIHIEDRTINVYAVVHVYQEELDFRIALDTSQLMDLFRNQSINPYIFTPRREKLALGMSIEKIGKILIDYKAEPKTLEEWHSLLDRLVEEDELRKACMVLTRIEKLFPNDYLIYYKKANLAAIGKVAHMSLVDIDVAKISVVEKNLKMLVDRNPKFAHGWSLLGDLYVEKKRWDKAIEAYSQCTMLEPDNHEAWKTLSTPHVHSGRYEEALEILNRAKDLKPEDSDIIVMIRSIQVELGLIK